MSTNIVNIANLSNSDYSVYANMHPLQVSYPVTIQDNDKKTKTVVNVRLLIDKDDNNFIIFKIQTSEFVKANLNHKDGSGKFIKGMIEIWNDAICFYFDHNFRMRNVIYSVSLFPNTETILDNQSIQTRSELASIFLKQLELGVIPLIKYSQIDESKKVPIMAFDTTSLLLPKLIALAKLEYKESKQLLEIKMSEWCSINQNEVLQAFIACGEILKKMQIPLIPGTFLHQCIEVSNKLLTPAKPDDDKEPTDDTNKEPDDDKEPDDANNEPTDDKEPTDDNEPDNTDNSEPDDTDKESTDDTDKEPTTDKEPDDDNEPDNNESSDNESSDNIVKPDNRKTTSK